MIEPTQAGLRFSPPLQVHQGIATDTPKADTPSVRSSDNTQQPNEGKAPVVSRQAQNMESLQQELQSLPDVDMVKVNEIRTLLASGNYEIDLDGLAASIRSTYSYD